MIIPATLYGATLWDTTKKNTDWGERVVVAFV